MSLTSVFRFGILDRRCSFRFCFSDHQMSRSPDHPIPLSVVRFAFRFRAIPAMSRDHGDRRASRRLPPPLPIHPIASQVIPDWRRVQRFCCSDHPMSRSPDHPILITPLPLPIHPRSSQIGVDLTLRHYSSSASSVLISGRFCLPDHGDNRASRGQPLPGSSQIGVDLSDIIPSHPRLA